MCRKESIVIVSAIVEVRLSVKAAAMPCSFIRFISSIVNVLRSFSTAIGAVRLFVSIVVSI